MTCRRPCGRHTPEAGFEPRATGRQKKATPKRLCNQCPECTEEHPQDSPVSLRNARPRAPALLSRGEVETQFPGAWRCPDQQVQGHATGATGITHGDPQGPGRPCAWWYRVARAPGLSQPRLKHSAAGTCGSGEEPSTCQSLCGGHSRGTVPRSIAVLRPSPSLSQQQRTEVKSHRHPADGGTLEAAEMGKFCLWSLLSHRAALRSASPRKLRGSHIHESPEERSPRGLGSTAWLPALAPAARCPVPRCR